MVQQFIEKLSLPQKIKYYSKVGDKENLIACQKEFICETTSQFLKQGYINEEEYDQVYAMANQSGFEEEKQQLLQTYFNLYISTINQKTGLKPNEINSDIRSLIYRMKQENRGKKKFQFSGLGEHVQGIIQTLIEKHHEETQVDVFDALKNCSRLLYWNKDLDELQDSLHKKVSKLAISIAAKGDRKGFDDLTGRFMFDRTQLLSQAIKEYSYDDCLTNIQNNFDLNQTLKRQLEGAVIRIFEYASPNTSFNGYAFRIYTSFPQIIKAHFDQSKIDKKLLPHFKDLISNASTYYQEPKVKGKLNEFVSKKYLSDELVTKKIGNQVTKERSLEGLDFFCDFNLHSKHQRQKGLEKVLRENLVKTIATAQPTEEERIEEESINNAKIDTQKLISLIKEYAGKPNNLLKAIYKSYLAKKFAGKNQDWRRYTSADHVLSSLDKTIKYSLEEGFISQEDIEEFPSLLVTRELLEDKLGESHKHQIFYLTTLPLQNSEVISQSFIVKNGTKYLIAKYTPTGIGTVLKNISELAEEMSGFEEKYGLSKKAAKLLKKRVFKNIFSNGVRGLCQIEERAQTLSNMLKKRLPFFDLEQKDFENITGEWLGKNAECYSLDNAIALYSAFLPNSETLNKLKNISDVVAN